MSPSLRMAVALALAFTVLACDKERAGTSTTTRTETKTESRTAGGDQTTETKTTVTRTIVTAEVGVAECDEYVQKMTACSTKVAADAAGPMMESTATMKKAWKDAAAIPDTRLALATGCKQALDTARNAYTSDGCQF